MTPPRILVVDDSSAMRRMLVRTLQLSGVEPEEIAQAVDGADALQKLEAMAPHLPDLLVTDITMPNLDGTGLLREVKARGWNQHFRIAVCTSISTSRTLMELVRLGAEIVIRKPFERAEVALQLSELLTPAEPPPPAPEPVPVPAANVGHDEAVWRHLDTAFEDVLERMTYTEAQPLTADQARVMAQNRMHCCSRIPFDDGRGIAIWATPKVCETLASNLTGDEPDGDDMAALDALSEVVNMVAGHWLKGRLESGEAHAGDVVISTPRLSVHLPGVLPNQIRRAYALDGTADHLFVSIGPMPGDEHEQHALTGESR